MNNKPTRKVTKYTGVYYNEASQKYDVKYNYKVYDVKTGKNVYKSKWIYNIKTLAEARHILAEFHSGKSVSESKEITLQGVFELWKIKAKGQNFSPVTIYNTERYMKIIYKFLPPDTKLKDINEDVYYKFCTDIRAYGYSEESLSTINATFRKLINLAYKKKLIEENILNYADNMRLVRKTDYRVIEKREFDEIDWYFKNKEFWHVGINNYPKYRLLFNILYYCGLRIGEALALTYNDFEEYTYSPLEYNDPSAHSSEPARGVHIKVTKARIKGRRITKAPKNLKNRIVPLSEAPIILFNKIKNEHLCEGGSLDDFIFVRSPEACDVALKKACAAMKLKSCSCHDFRHTFISNLIRKGVPLPVVEKISGDTQTTILKRYSHVFKADEIMVLTALKEL